MRLEEIVKRFDGARRAGNGFMVKCPCHADSNQSLSISEGDGGKVLLHCFAGCETRDILAKVGLSEKDLFNDAPPARIVKREVAWYTYTDRDGKPIVQVVRFEPKEFRRKSPDGSGGWKWGGTGSAAALYRWPQLARACAAGCARVWLVEGEKDCENMVKLGPEVIATTALGGASKWRAEYAAEFAGAKEVFIIADNDSDGSRHKGQRDAIAARDAIRNAGVNATAAVLPPEINGRRVKDASDAIAAGWKLADFEAWAEVASDLNAGDFEEDSDEGRCELETVLLKTVRDLRNRTDGHLKAADEAKAVSKAGIAWLLEHGSFFLDEEVRDTSGTFYYFRPEKRLFYMGDKVDSPLYFAAWLSARSGYPRGGSIFRQFFVDCQTVATATDKTTLFKPCRFWERRNGRLYISCGEGSMYRIAPRDGIDLVDNGCDGVVFRQGFTLDRWELLEDKALCPLECALFKNMAIEDAKRFDGYGMGQWLLLFWLMTLPLNLKNKPPLLLCGTVGSGKTRTAAGVFELFGFPKVRITPVREDGEQSFWTSVDQGGLVILDNADTKCNWLADAVASAATGGTNEVRKLYSNNDVIVLEARAAVILTSSNPYFAADAGVADRLEVVRLERNERDTADTLLTDDIKAKRNACMTWMCKVLLDALGSDAPPPRTLNRRHPDWGTWVWRFGKAIGKPNVAELVLDAAEMDKSAIFIENDAGFSGELVRIVRERGGFEGTCGQLLELFRASAEASGEKFRLSAKGFGRKLGSGWPYYARVLKAKKRKTHGIAIYTFSPPDDGDELADQSAEPAEVGGDNTNDNADGQDLLPVG